MVLVGFGGDLEDEVADLKFGVAEQGRRAAVDEGAGDLEELVLAQLGDGGGEFLGLDFLVSRQCFLHS